MKKIFFITLVSIYNLTNLTAQKKSTPETTKNWIISAIKSNWKEFDYFNEKRTFKSATIENENLIVNYFYDNEICYNGSYIIPIKSVKLEISSKHFFYTNCECIKEVHVLKEMDENNQEQERALESTSKYINNFINFDNEKSLKDRFKKALYQLKTFYVKS